MQDDNRYNAGRGEHLTLKRAKKARALLKKIPGKYVFTIKNFKSNLSPLLHQLL